MAGKRGNRSKSRCRVSLAIRFAGSLMVVASRCLLLLLPAPVDKKVRGSTTQQRYYEESQRAPVSLFMPRRSANDMETEHALGNKQPRDYLKCREKKCIKHAVVAAKVLCAAAEKSPAECYNIKGGVGVMLNIHSYAR
jgi:hypothetical protein